MTLSRSRPIGVGMASLLFQPIAVTEAIAMAGAIGWPPLDFLRAIGPADALYVDQLNQRKTR